MNLAQQIQSQVAGLPDDLQAEILDFICFIKQRRKPAVPLFVEKPGNSGTILNLLRSPAFKNVPAGDPAAMEALIQANRSAWDD